MVTLNNIEGWLRLFRGATRVNVKKTLQRKVKFTPIFTALLITVILTLSLFKPSSAALITEYNLVAGYNPDPRPRGIAVDDAGNVWFTEQYGNRIGLLSGTTIYEWKLPQEGSEPWDILVDDDGVVWFTEYGSNRIGRFKNPDYIAFDLTNLISGVNKPRGIALDGNVTFKNVWFTMFEGDAIGKLYYNNTYAPQRRWVYAAYKLPGLSNSGPRDIAISPYNGFIWFTLYNLKKIGSFNPWTLECRVYPSIELPGGAEYWIEGLTVDSSGFVWFSLDVTNPDAYDMIGRLNPWNGEVVFYEIPTLGSGPRQLVIDKNNHIWFTEYDKGKIGRLDPVSQYITEYQLPDSGVKPLGIALKKGGETPLYFTEWLGNKIGLLDPAIGLTSSTVNTITSATTSITTKTEGITAKNSVEIKRTSVVYSSSNAPPTATTTKITTTAGYSSMSHYATSTVTTNVETVYVKPATTTITTTSPIVHVSTTGTTKLDTLTTYVSTTSTTTTTTLTATYSTPVATETTVVTRYEVFTDYVSTTTLTEYAATSYRWKTTTAEYYTSYSTSTIKTTVTRTTTITQTATQYTSITQGTTILYTTVTTTTTRVLGASLGYATPTLIIAGLVWLLSNRSNKTAGRVKRG